MTAQQIKVHVTDPANQYRRLGFVTLKPIRGTRDREWEVYHGGEMIGAIRRRKYIPHTKLPGTRIRKDLAPRTVWDAYSVADNRETPRHERRNDALFRLIEKRTP